jgi:hypothetical protein
MRAYNFERRVKRCQTCWVILKPRTHFENKRSSYNWRMIEIVLIVPLLTFKSLGVPKSYRIFPPGRDPTISTGGTVLFISVPHTLLAFSLGSLTLRTPG